MAYRIKSDFRLLFGAATSHYVVAAPPSVAFVEVTDGTSLSGYDAHSGDQHAPGAVFTDLTGDGLPELFLGSTTVNQVYVNIPGGGFQLLASGPHDGPGGGVANGAVAADYDNVAGSSNYSIPNKRRYRCDSKRRYDEYAFLGHLCS